MRKYVISRAPPPTSRICFHTRRLGREVKGGQNTRRCSSPREIKFRTTSSRPRRQNRIPPGKAGGVLPPKERNSDIEGTWREETILLKESAETPVKVGL